MSNRRRRTYDPARPLQDPTRRRPFEWPGRVPDIRPLLNESLPAIGAQAVHNATPAYRGQGVLVGIIDTGVDWRHRGFIRGTEAEPVSRIRALWDHSLTRDERYPDEQPGPEDGIVYTQEEITNALRRNGTVRSRDYFGHGTLVAGIAAGDGSHSTCNFETCCKGEGTFVGVAPDAELLVAALGRPGSQTFSQTGILNALRWLFEQAGSTPMAVNISLGRSVGPHDGTSEVSRAIDELVTAQAGRAVIVAAGNDRDERNHAQGQVPAGGQVELNFALDLGRQYGFLDLTRGSVGAQADIYYKRGEALNLEILRGSTSMLSVDHRQGGQDTTNDFLVGAINEVEGTLYTNDSGTGNPIPDFTRDNYFGLFIGKPAGRSWGQWTVRLRNPGSSPVAFHFWLVSGDRLVLSAGQSNTASTLGDAATSRQAITVASHGLGGSLDQISPFSSQGPVVRVTDYQQPTIAAPGEHITSASADAPTLLGNSCESCGDDCCQLYRSNNGTSLAAPHVTGTVALMLEKNPTLTIDQIKQALIEGATSVPSATVNDWGVAQGRLNTQASLDRVAAPTPAPGAFAFAAAPPPPPPSPIAAAPEPAKAGAGFEDIVRILRARASAIPNGTLFTALISLHFSEGRRLVNSQRRLATLWHRAQGPRMMRRIIEGALDPDAPAPLDPSSDERRYFERFLDRLAVQGSPRLQASLTNYRSLALRMLGTPLARQVLSSPPVA